MNKAFPSVVDACSPRAPASFRDSVLGSFLSTPPPKATLNSRPPSQELVFIGEASSVHWLFAVNMTFEMGARSLPL